MKSSKEFKTGLFVIVTLIAVVVTVNYLRGNGFLQKSNIFITSYTDVQGLNPATPVYINGFKAGSVTSMKYNKSHDRFDIKLNISGDFDIPEDSRTEIYSSDILGGKSIRVIFGQSMKPASSGDTLAGFVSEDPLSAIMADIPSIIQKVDTLTTNLNVTVRGINDVLNDTNKNNISSLIASLRQSADNIKSITGGINSKTPEITEMISQLKDLSISLNEASVKLNTTLENAGNITEELTDAGLKDVVENINKLVIKLQDPNGSIGQMMTTDSLHNSLNGLLDDIDSLVNKIKENPRKNLKISVF